MPSWLYLAVPLAVLPVVMLLGFVGCGLDSTGIASPDDPANPDNPDNPDDPVDPVDPEVPDPYNTVIEATAGLVAYWPLGESSGTTAHDAVGPPPDGSHPGTYTTWTAPADAAAGTDAANGVLTLGQPGLISNDASRKSVAVDGGYAEVPFAAELNTPEFTFELLLQTEWDATAMAAYRCVLSAREMAAGNLGGFGLYANPTNHWEATIRVGTPTTSVTAVADDPPIAFGAIEALAITYDGTALSLYVNGVLRGSVTPEPGASYVPNTSRPLLIGAREDDDLSVIFPFKGRLQEVACYNRALSQDEIVAHLKAGSI